MDSDRRSAVSSFYGGRKSSVDMLNDTSRVQGGPSGSRHDLSRDDASSFYGMGQTGGPGRGSSDLLVSPGGRPGYGQSAGYNRNSFFHTGREAPVKGIADEEDEFMGSRRDLGGPGPNGNPGDEEAGWNVFADFNNFGPRYSTAFNQGNVSSGYQPIQPERSGTPVKTENDNASQNATGAPVELVTVPVLGAEWKKTEMEAMTKRGRKKAKNGEKWDNFRAWTRDQRGCCGRWGTRKQIAILLFVICAIVAIALVFTIPRVPSFSFNSSSPLQNGTGSPELLFSRAPANFSFSAKLDLKADTNGAFLPTKMNNISAKIFDSQTNMEVGTGEMQTTFPAKTFTEFLLPLNFTYIAPNDTDITWNNWYNACKNKALYSDGNRPGLNFRVEMMLSIAGLIGQKKANTQIANVACPVELPQNAA